MRALPLIRENWGPLAAGVVSASIVLLVWLGLVVLLGAPKGTAPYEFMRDQGGWLGGIVAGLFTLAGGALAYLAGYIQAQRTMEAARLQVAVAKEQMAQELAVITDRDRREAKALVAGLSAEASRLKMILAEAAKSHGRRVGHEFEGTIRGTLAETYIAEPDPAIRTALIGDAALNVQVVDAAREFYAQLDKLNALIRVRAPYGDLLNADLREAFIAATDAASRLQRETSLALAAT